MADVADSIQTRRRESSASRCGRHSELAVGLTAIVVAGLLPLSALLLAGHWATSQVRRSTVVGSEATASAVAERAAQSYQQALVTLEAAPGRPSLVQAVAARDPALAAATITDLRLTGPFLVAGLFDPAGRLIAESPAGTTPPAPAPMRPGATVEQGPLREVGDESLRSVTVAVTSAGGRPIGSLTAAIDLTRLIPGAAGLTFAKTGKTIIVGTDTRVLVDTTTAHVGMYLETPVSQRLARSHRQGTAIVTTLLSQRHVVEVYEPAQGQPFGALTSQSTSEAFAGVNHLAGRLRLLAAISAALGLLLAGLVTAILRARDRSIRAKTAAIAATEVFHSAFDHAPSGVALVGLDGRLLYVNRSLCELLGGTEDAILARRFDELAHPDDGGLDLFRLEEMTCDGANCLFVEMRLITADARNVWAAVSGSVVADGQGRPNHYVTHFTDVTERREAVAALSVAIEQVAEARDAAEAATCAKSAFLATMSHEIRTPMNAIIGLTGMLLETSLDTDQRYFTETVRDSGDSLLVIINDILDFSKIEAGGLELESLPFEVRDCVEGAIALVALAAEKKGLELVAELDDSCPAIVVGDVTRFRQVIVNLLSNAVKFTAVGEVHVVVAGQPAAESSGGVDRITVSVRDTGIGIPADRMDRLFRSFTQVDSSTTRTHGGTGLGLVISRRLAIAMGGDLEVTSRPGAGSTFTFSAVAPVAAERRSADVGSTSDLDGTSVLIVDDNGTSRRVLGQMAGRWGMACTGVASADEALALVSGGRRFDLAIVDMDMPGTDGLQLGDALRGLPAGEHLPMLLLTSLQPLLTSEQRAVFAATVTKPVRSLALREKLLTTLKPEMAAVLAAETAGGRRVSDGPATSGRALHVLLAEDNPINQKVANLMLTKLGHQVDIVNDGLEAVQAVEANRYDIVFMDVQMPRLDGLEATARIRSGIAPDRQPAIVAMTASVLVEDRAACTEAGMDAYLAKPVRSSELEAVIALVGPRTGHKLTV